MSSIGYHDPCWGRVEPGWRPEPSTMRQIHRGLREEIDQELAQLSIEQQAVIVAARHAEEDAWTVGILNAPPPRGTYDSWAECLIDFDQYCGSIEGIRQGVAEALADELMEQTFPGWRDPAYGKPEPDWEADWH